MKNVKSSKTEQTPIFHQDEKNIAKHNRLVKKMLNHHKTSGNWKWKTVLTQSEQNFITEWCDSRREEVQFTDGKPLEKLKLNGNDINAKKGEENLRTEEVQIVKMTICPKNLDPYYRVRYKQGETNFTRMRLQTSLVKLFQVEEATQEDS